MEDYSQVVDKSRPEPVYQQVADWMTYRITVGDWQENLRLPAEPDLAKALGVSRSSLRKALGLLSSRQLLLQVHGKGTFVRRGAVEARMEQRLRSVSEILNAWQLPYASTILVQRLVPPPPKVRAALSIQDGQQVVHLKWLLRLDNTPFLLSDTHVPGSRCQALLHTDFRAESLYATLERVCGIHIERSHDVYAAVAAQPEVAERLGVERGAPALYIERILYDDHQKPVLYSESWSRSDRLRLTMEAIRRPEDSV